MSRIDELRDLLGEFETYQAVSQKLLEAVDHLVSIDLPAMGKKTTTAVAAAGLIESVYTATETVLFRIAQNFGNNLQKDRWHSDLLHRMTHPVPDVRPALLSPMTYSLLDELLRFRHFKRYYFNLEFDWDRLEHLIGVVRKAVPAVQSDLDEFGDYVRDVVAILSES